MPFHEDGTRPDNEHMRKLSGPGGPLAARWCARCDSHYEYCKCKEPDWKLRNEGKLGPMPGEQDGPECSPQTLQDLLDHGLINPREN